MNSEFNHKILLRIEICNLVLALASFLCICITQERTNHNVYEAHEAICVPWVHSTESYNKFTCEKRDGLDWLNRGWGPADWTRSALQLLWSRHFDPESMLMKYWAYDLAKRPDLFWKIARCQKYATVLVAVQWTLTKLILVVLLIHITIIWWHRRPSYKTRSWLMQSVTALVVTVIYTKTHHWEKSCSVFARNCCAFHPF